VRIVDEDSVLRIVGYVHRPECSHHSVSNPITSNAFSGAYNLMDVDGAMFAFHDKTLMKFSNGGGLKNVESTMVRAGQFPVPSTLFRSNIDYPLGLSILYDGNLVFTTHQGMLTVISRSFQVLATLALGAGPEEISNSLAVDENNGIYVVSSAKMRKIQWNGSTVDIAWESDYQTGGSTRAAGRLGAGSGTTPSLMGTKPEDDKFVVITDGAKLMNMVLFWRDTIPADWRGLPGKDRRIAAEVPVTFGDDNAQTSVTEQSVLVRGYGAMVVNNDYGVNTPAKSSQPLFVLATGMPRFTPKGMEKFEWNPATRILDSVWSNQISCSNGIPTMSATSDLAYCLGRRQFTWTVEAVSWRDGSSAFFQPLGFRPRYNSAYSAMQIVDDKEILSGSFLGGLRVQVTA
jgi:hypothetical protein